MEMTWEGQIWRLGFFDYLLFMFVYLDYSLCILDVVQIAMHLYEDFIADDVTSYDHCK